MKNIKRVALSFRDYCNRNIGLITLASLIVFICYSQDFGEIGKPISSFFTWFLSFLNTKIEIPAYFFFILMGAVGVLMFRAINNRPYLITSKKILVGQWRNDWGPPNAGYEYLTINKKLEYYVNGAHQLNIMNFVVDLKTNRIRFNKVGAKPGDMRSLFNDLHIESENVLVGSEAGYPIKYTRIDM